MYENDTLKWRNFKVAELKVVLTVVQADTCGSKQALVDRCLDEHVAFEIKEQLLAACRGVVEEREGEEGEADSEDGEDASEDDAECSSIYLG
jgi:hypothetical protein